MARKEDEPIVRGLWEREPDSGIWWIRYRGGDGKLHREKVGRKGDAKDLLNKRRNERRVGIKMPENLRTVPIRFGEIADHITEEFTQEHHEDSRNIKQRLGKLKAFFGERSAESIKPEEIDRWLGQNTKTGSTANRYRSAMSLAFREAIRNGKLQSNPVRLVRQRKEGNGVIRFLRDEEEKALRKWMAKHYSQQLWELDVSLGTGMRLTEQYGKRLLWKQVRFERKEIELKTTKNGKGRIIPMNASVLAAMKTRRSRVPRAKPDEPVFPMQPRSWWDDVRKNANLQDYRWHDNRHTFCSRLAMRGVNLVAIRDLAGHKTLAITARYAHLDDSAKRECRGLVDGATKC